MRRLDEKMAELCPNGVEFKKLGDICSLEKGQTPIQKAVPGEYPLVVTTTERKSSNQYQFSEPSVCIPLISSRGHGVASLSQVYYQEGRFALGNILCGVTPHNQNELQAKFLFYYLNHMKDLLIVPLMRGGANVALSIDSLKRIKVPVPPLDIQKRVTETLDIFEDLSSLLSLELSARRRQYEYYREKLLTYGEDVPYKSLDELCSISAGGDAPKEKMSKYKTDEFKVPIISNGIGNNAFYGYTNEPRITKPAVTISARGTIGYAEYRAYPYFPTVRLLSVIPKDKMILNTKYLYYCLQGKQYDVPTSGIPQLTAPMLRKEKIPVPAIDVQEIVVSILDNFDVICTDLYSGLPAEIEARRKQYEYYRDKLLAFKELQV